MAHTATRDPEREALWRQRIAQQAASGLTVRDWCRQDGYSDSLFHFWKSTLAKRDGVYTAPPRRAPAPPKQPRSRTPARVFAQVVLAAPQPKPQTAPSAPVGAPAPPALCALELVLPGGRLVRVREGFDPATLTRLLDVLEACSC